MSKDYVLRDKEESLDPKDWEQMRTLGYRMVDDMLKHLATIRQKPVWQPIPASVKTNLDEKLPYEPQDLNKVYESFLENILPYSNGNAHPRFFGWVQGNGTALAMLADMLAAGMNPHMAGFVQSPTLVEHLVIAWLTELMGMPSESSGLLVSGGTMANIIGLAVARQTKAGFDIREEGLSGHPQLTIYCSSETHSWIKKGAQLLGLGNRAIREIEVDKSFRIDIRALSEKIAKDRQSGVKPICVVGTIGTVNTGAIDNLEAVADIAKQEGLWFHIDGAFGALVKLSNNLSSLAKGLEKADSLAFDLHKWMYLPFEVACVLVKDKKAHHSTFQQTAKYFNPASRGVIAEGIPFAERGIELTRNFKALKVWMSLKAHGINTFAKLIEQNIYQAKYLASIVESHPELELLAPVSLNIVCFRYKSFNQEQLNQLNQEILLRLQESGIALPSSTIIEGQYCIRVAIVNHRSRVEDFELLVSEIVKLGRKIAKEF